MYKFLYEQMFSVLLSIYIGIASNHKIPLFWGIANLFSPVDVPFYISSVMFEDSSSSISSTILL